MRKKGYKSTLEYVYSSELFKKINSSGDFFLIFSDPIIPGHPSILIPIFSCLKAKKMITGTCFLNTRR